MKPAALSNTSQSPPVKRKTQPKMLKKSISPISRITPSEYFFRDPFSDFITRRIRVFLGILFVAVVCDIFLAKPILNNAGTTEIQLLNELMTRANENVMSNFESTLRFLNASMTIPNPMTKDRMRDPTHRPGYLLADQGARAKHPVVMIPGFITSGLELWASEECGNWRPRQRIWGSLQVFLQSVLKDMMCYQRHLALDPITGSDPPNIKLRSAQGFEAADWFMNTIWVWDKLIENLSDVGYDASNMIMMSFDWRLSFPMLEERDGYFTKLKGNIEALVKTSKEPVVITSHSMGSQIVLYFFKWVTTDESEGGGGGGADWVDKHVHAFVNVAGPLLGVPKAASALLSGEMKDTAELLGPMGAAVERVFGRKNRKDLFTTWGSLWHMLPIGGDAIWGTGRDIITNQESSQECVPSNNNFQPLQGTHYHVCSVARDRYIDPKAEALIVFTEGTSTVNPDSLNTTSDYELLPTDSDSEVLLLEKSTQTSWWSSSDAITFLKEWGGGYGSGIHAARLSEQKNKIESWSDPTTNPLPHAPSTKLYCMYGVGIETERAYFYKRVLPDSNAVENDIGTLPLSQHLPFIMDSSVNDPEQNIKVGVRFSDGDISVPLVSLGYMCADAWKNSPRLNPSNMEIITKEYANKGEWQVNDPMRGGPHSSNHVDILGNVEVTMDIIKVATNFRENEVQDHFVSDIHQIAQEVNKKFHSEARTI